MKTRNLIKIGVLCCVTAAMLSGCGKGSADGPTTVTAPPQSQAPSQDDPAAQDTFGLDFNLTSPETPSFADPDKGNQGGVSDGLYTILEDGFAYALDPLTFEPTGPALDPITHEEIKTEPSQEPSVEPTVEPSIEPTLPPEDIRLPNTGKFLEDD